MKMIGVEWICGFNFFRIGYWYLAKTRTFVGFARKRRCLHAFGFWCGFVVYLGSRHFTSSTQCGWFWLIWCRKWVPKLNHPSCLSLWKSCRRTGSITLTQTPKLGAHFYSTQRIVWVCGTELLGRCVNRTVPPTLDNMQTLDNSEHTL